MFFWIILELFRISEISLEMHILLFGKLLKYYICPSFYAPTLRGGGHLDLPLKNFIFVTKVEKGVGHPCPMGTFLVITSVTEN